MSSYGRWIITAGLCFMLIAAAFAARDGQQRDRLVVHEWGTFTVLQDERGREVAGINNDDEPLPPFVHRLVNGLVTAESKGVGFNPFAKGIVMGHPDVVMRLETPVVYFHLPEGVEQMQLDLSVGFRGGWISEWYPTAATQAPGVRQELNSDGRRVTRIGHLLRDAVGTIEWHDVIVGGTAGPFPQTDDNVWLAPRKVDSAPLATSDGQAEQYLFYRGVGNVRSPLRVIRDGRNILNIEAQFEIPSAGPVSLQVPSMWLVDILPDETLSFRSMNGFEANNGAARRIVATTPGELSGHSREQLGELRASMKAALVADGLFADEADAMLSTWEAAYFQTPGTRLFYLMPQAWTDHVLPLTISAPAQVKRVMVGRVELVTPAQRKLMEQITTAASTSSPAWLLGAIGQSPSADDPQAFSRLLSGDASLEEMSVTPPADWHAYRQLGRFRHAMILHEMKHNPTEALERFTRNYGIRHSSVNQ